MTDFIWKIAVRKMVERFIQSLVAMIPAFLPLLEKYGIKLEINEAVLIASVMALVELARNWFKHQKKG